MNELIKRFAEVQKISYEEAEKQIGADTDEKILDNISQITINKINEQYGHMNRKQRRALAKKTGKKKQPETQVDAIVDTAKKLNYIELIEKLRKLNAEKEKDENEDSNEDN